MNITYIYIYGTTDKKRVALTKYGLNISLVNRLMENNQIDDLIFNEFNNLKTTSKFDEYVNTLNDFHQFEIKRFIYINIL